MSADPLDRDWPATAGEFFNVRLVLQAFNRILATQDAWEFKTKTGRYKKC